MQLRKLVVSLKDVLLSFMFTAFSNPAWFNWFKFSPISILNKASLGIVTIVLACMQCYFFYQAVNKNFEAWSNTLSAVVGTGLTSVATFGEMFATALGLSFAAGIWIFLAGLMVSMVNQLIELGINLHRSLEAPKGSSQRKHYQQAAIQHAFNAMHIALTITSLACLMLLPVNPVLVTGFCLAVVSFGVLNVAWRMGPKGAKEQLKQGVGLTKPIHEPSFAFKKPHHSNPLFTATDFISPIKTLSLEDQKTHLQLKIADKSSQLRMNTSLSLKQENKIKVLELLSNALEDPIKLDSKSVIAKHYIGAFQSFWREKSDVEQLYDAVMFHLNHLQADENRFDNSKIKI